MKIASSSLSMSVSHQYKETFQQKLSMRTPLDSEQDGNPMRGRQDVLGESSRNVGMIAAEFSLLATRSQEMSAVAVSNESELEPGEDKAEAFKLRLIQAMMEQITGKTFETFDTQGFQKKLADAEIEPVSGNSNATGGNAAANMATNGFQEINYYEKYTETERLSVDMKGQIETADGQTIDVNLSLTMTRHFMAENHIQISTQPPTDPLVINFDGRAAELTERNFSFDLDNDGTEDQIAFVKPGSGFLALDKNNDGLINNGSELFGPSTNDGFAELRAYDDDNNGWIDESDSIFDKLRIWVKGRNGPELFALGDKNIGAISLKALESPFTIKDEHNQALGQVRQTSLALKESGEAVTVQHLDLFA